jgi:hypothetical protein
MGRKVGISAYGTVEDRQRLEALASLRHISSSQWVIEIIREKHAEVFAPLPPPTDEEILEEIFSGT